MSNVQPTPLVAPFLIELDDNVPIVVAEAAQAFAMATAYMEGAPPNTMVVITDAAGNVWAMKTTDQLEVIVIPF